MQKELKTAFFISFTLNHAIAAHALINSILAYNHTSDIIINYRNDCNSYIEYLKKHVCKKENFIFIGPSSLKNPNSDRWHILLDIFDNYDAIVILDADMLVLSNWDLELEISSKANVIMASRDQAQRIYDYSWKHQDNTKMFEKDILHLEYICGVPTIFPNNAKDVIIEICRILNNKNEERDDMEVVNISLIRTKWAYRMITFPTEIHTHTHLTFMSPKTRIIHRNDLTQNIITHEKDNIHGVFMTSGHVRIKGWHGKPWLRDWVKAMRDVFNKHMSNAFGFSALFEQNLTNEQNISSEIILNKLRKEGEESLCAIIGLFYAFLDCEIPWSWEYAEPGIKEFLEEYEKNKFNFNKLITIEQKKRINQKENKMTKQVDIFLRHHDQTIEVLKKHFGEKKITGFEVGTNSGLLTMMLLRNIPNLVLLQTCDPWKNYPGAQFEAGNPQEYHDVQKAEALQRLSEYFGRFQIYQMESDAAFDKFKQHKMYVDFVWIDGHHEKSQVDKDIENALKIVKQNGLIGGHDYGLVSDVTQSVKEHFSDTQINLGGDFTWWIYI